MHKTNPISDQNSLKAIPFGATHTYLANIRYEGVHPPPPHPLPALENGQTMSDQTSENGKPFKCKLSCKRQLNNKHVLPTQCWMKMFDHLAGLLNM